MPTLNHPSGYGPPATALLLLDYHQLFVQRIQDEEARRRVISSAQILITAARKSRVPIFHCLVDKDDNAVPTSKLAGQWESAIKAAMAVNGAEHPELAPSNSGENIEERTILRQPGHVSALKSQGLLARLKELGVKSLVLCGLSSSGCVLSTARHASDEEFVVGVVQDGCWDPQEGVHEVVMDVLTATAWVFSTDEAVRTLEGNATGT